MPENKYQRLVIFDQLRGLSILMIVLYHFTLELSQFSIRPKLGTPSENIHNLFFIHTNSSLSFLGNFFSALFSFGWQYVGVFLFLSGFGLTYSRLIKGGGEQFFLRRILRLVPSWQFAILFAYLINLLGHKYFSSLIISQPTLNFSYYFSFLLFPIIGDYFLNYVGGINPSLWFIFLIFQFYIFYDLIFMALKKLGVRKFFWVSLIICVAFRAVAIFVFHDLPSAQGGVDGRRAFLLDTLLARVFEFGLGMTLAKLIVDKKLELSRLVNMKALMIGLSLWFIGNLATWNILGWTVSDLLLTPGLVLISLYLLKPLKKTLGSALNLIGANADFIYMFHNQPITQILLPLTLIWSIRLGKFVPLYVGELAGLVLLIYLISYSRRLFAR